MKFKMNQSGIKKYIASLRKRVDEIKDEVLISTKKHLEQNSPVRTGYLRDSYYIEGDAIGNRADYLWFVNDGTVKQVGQHFVELSIAEVNNEYDKICDAVVKRN